jgi:omega-hydroxy-beta-dihydromenaquinone-9 sulfotransferase
MNQPRAASTNASKPRGAKNAYPLRSPRFWHGLRFGEWLALLARHQFRVHPVRWPMAAAITCITPFNSIMGACQSLWYGRQIANTTLVAPPVFILGHWRSGTTLLHEFMSLDDRFGSPTTYQCFAPRHFLLTEWLIANYMGFLVPKQRPMDNMAAGWNRPQEDEFALLTLNAPTPYARMAFPNDPPPHMNLLDMHDVPQATRQQFESALLYFAKLITFRTRKQLLFKSPPHTGRIAMLAKLFPGAKFVHITRDPYEIFASTVRLWESLDDVQGLQRPHHRDLQEYVFTAFERMYSGFESQRTSLPANHILDVRYEDLVRDPVTKVSEIYAQLGLSEFAALEPKLQAFLSTQKDYQPNRHELAPELRHTIRTRWNGYFERYGYA